MDNTTLYCGTERVILKEENNAFVCGASSCHVHEYIERANTSVFFFPMLLGLDFTLLAKDNTGTPNMRISMVHVPNKCMVVFNGNVGPSSISFRAFTGFICLFVYFPKAGLIHLLTLVEDLYLNDGWLDASLRTDTRKTCAQKKLG